MWSKSFVGFVSLVVFTCSFMPTESLAKKFQSKFVQLQLPPGWDCVREELDYLCQPDNMAERSEVLLVIVTKAVNEVDDHLEQYKSILSESRQMRDLLGNSYNSQVRYVREKEILGRTWIDSLQQGSEVPGFFTRYLASINERVAGLVTYSIAESVYPKWAAVMDRVVDSLVLTFDPAAFDEALSSGPSSLLGARGGRSKNRFAPTLEGESLGDEEGSSSSSTIFGLLLIAGAAGYLVWKRKQRKV